MNDQAARTLKALIARYGTSVALDPLRCEGLLRDTCPRCNREIFVLVNAVRQQVPADLLAPRHSLPLPLFRGFLKKRLQDELAFSDEAAHWAVDTWADALGLDPGADQREPTEVSGTGEREGAPCVPDAGYTGTGPEQRAEWATELESGGIEARLAAIGKLAHSEDRGNIRLLITCLENSSWRARQAAFDALVLQGAPAVPYLIEALADSHERVVISVVIVIGAIRAHEAVTPLIALLDSGGEPAAYGAWALGEIGDERAITPLTRLLNSRNARLRSESEQALMKFD
ncbi:MAG: HEAT repeat domain-containing protein [Methanoregula sp.]|nr:HEAT repeat domain-containing protein [Methanoregula sp.]